MAYEGLDYDRSLRVIYYVFAGVVLTLFVAFVLFRTIEPNPENSKAFGCYSSSEAPPILLNQQGMKILQATPLQFAYHLERQKTGIALTADEPIAAEPSTPGYVYSIRQPGAGNSRSACRARCNVSCGRSELRTDAPEAIPRHRTLR